VENFCLANRSLTGHGPYSKVKRLKIFFSAEAPSRTRWRAYNAPPYLLVGWRANTSLHTLQQCITNLSKIPSQGDQNRHCSATVGVQQNNYVLVLDLEKARHALDELKHLSNDACDTLEYRIEAVLEKMATVELCVLPTDEPVTIDEFLATTEASCTEAAETLTKSVCSSHLRRSTLRANSLSFTCFLRIFDTVGCGRAFFLTEN